ncbi:cytochrome c biogenesis CcdA family protein [Demequina muriae]|uniref:Cytochrome c biogenesis CcdA family protein n=1 Tax=Demequina muriae TaxID=3051664 RepID=A0ABT8GGB9_9MICO|nr:cytochrome c biogenesis CcdA family protein [Demequina sp. EGI L300058]MDN4480470.1 cytochrome c biogenesis CcdA family protein [Demequina sp. EGI L300058]
MLDATVAAYVLLLGAVAAFNPCGFALLPAYITVIVTGSADAGVTRAVALRRAVGFGLAMTLGFMVVFTGFGLLFGAVNLGLQGSVLPYVSYVTVAIGAILVWLGIVMLRGGQLRGPGLRVSGGPPRRAFWSQVGYGASFAVASLSCTIGLFLAVVAHALAATGPVGAVAPFLIYGAGMGASVLAISMVAAVAGSAAAAAMRRHTPLLMRVGGGLMVLAGLYVLVFGLAEVLLRYDIDTLNPVLTTTAQWQSGVSAWIESWGTAVLVAFVAIVALTATAILIAARRGGRHGDPRPQADEVGGPPAVPSAAAFTVADSATLDYVRRASRHK